MGNKVYDACNRYLWNEEGSSAKYLAYRRLDPVGKEPGRPADATLLGTSDSSEIGFIRPTDQLNGGQTGNCKLLRSDCDLFDFDTEVRGMDP